MNLIWSVADLLRDDYRQTDYEKVILLLTVPHRLDCLLEKKKQKVIDAYPEYRKKSDQVIDLALNKISGYKFHIEPELITDDQLISQAQNNTINNFKYG